MFVNIQLVKAGLAKVSCDTHGCGPCSDNQTPQKDGDSPTVIHHSSASVSLSTSLLMASRETTLSIYRKHRSQTQSVYISSFHATTTLPNFLKCCVLSTPLEDGDNSVFLWSPSTPFGFGPLAINGWLESLLENVVL